MTCSEIKLLLSEYIDDTLSAEDRLMVDKHLKDCKTCQVEYVSLKNMLGELNEIPRIKAPNDFLENLHTRMESKVTLNTIIKKLFVPWIRDLHDAVVGIAKHVPLGLDGIIVNDQFEGAEIIGIDPESGLGLGFECHQMQGADFFEHPGYWNQDSSVSSQGGIFNSALFGYILRKEPITGI